MSAHPSSAAEAGERALALLDSQSEITARDLLARQIVGSNIGGFYVLLDLEKAGRIVRSARGWKRAEVTP